jgi:transglutaminase-like putative cysteine protease
LAAASSAIEANGSSAELRRASQAPARAVSAYGWRLEAPDMHAFIEVYVGGKWRLAGPTGKVEPQHLVRVAMGRDAADIAFMSVFGQAQLVAQTFGIAQANS